MADYDRQWGWLHFGSKAAIHAVGLVSFGLGGASNDRTLSIAAHTGGGSCSDPHPWYISRCDCELAQAGARTTQ